MPSDKIKPTQHTFVNNVIKPDRDIIASGAEDLKAKLLKTVNDGLKELVIDLANVEVVDSVGLGVVISAHNSINTAGGKLKVINASEDIFRLFQTMRLDQHFEVSRSSG